MSLAVCLLASFAAAAAPAARPGALVNRDGEPVAWSEFAQRAQGAAIVLVGESHTSRCDHRVQAKVLDVMARGGLGPAVGLEMVAVDQSLVLKKFNEGRIAPAAMARALDWGQNWGFPFRLYQPLFEVARRHRLPMVALNAPQMAAFLVGRHDVEPEELRPRAVTVAPTIPPSPRQLAELKDEFEAHAGYLGEKVDFEHFALVQSMWDTKMAMEAVKAARTLRRPIVILAGAGHVEPLGIPYRLQVLAPELPALSLMPWRGEGKPEADEADLFFYCPQKPAHRPPHGEKKSQ